MSNVEKALTRVATGSFTVTLNLDVSSPHRYIIFSDVHKGAGDRADEFRKCKKAYAAALEHYLSEGFTLVLLGDVEDLWEQGFRSVEKAHSDMLELEGSFPLGKYFRIWGNHDDLWMLTKKVCKHLSPYMPGGGVIEALRLEICQGYSKHLGSLLLLHGHQGTFEAEKIRHLARLALRLHRYLQRWFGIGRQCPAKDACLRGKHDTRLYQWAEQQDRLILIAGHTHRPVWSSKTHVQKLEAELVSLQQKPECPDLLKEIDVKRSEVARCAEKYPPCEDTIKPKPCYFNTGCCKFDDGDITGMELVDGELRLVKWCSKTDPPVRTVMEADQLVNLFGAL